MKTDIERKEEKRRGKGELMKRKEIDRGGKKKHENTF